MIFVSLILSNTIHSETCPVRQWYNGCTLLEALDSFKDPTRRVDAPLRAVITSVISEDAKGVYLFFDFLVLKHFVLTGNVI